MTFNLGDTVEKAMICGKIVSKTGEDMGYKYTLHAPCGLDKGHEGECSVKAFGERLAKDEDSCDESSLKTQLQSSIIVSETLAEDVGRLHEEIARLREEVAQLKLMLIHKSTAHCPDCGGDLVVAGTVTMAYYHLTAVCPASTKKV